MWVKIKICSHCPLYFAVICSLLSLITGMQDASKKLTESLHEVYEPDWYGREDVKMIGEVRYAGSGKRGVLASSGLI